MNHLIYWIWLSLRCGAGSELGSYLLRHFKDPKAIYEADKASLLQVEGIDGNILSALMDKELTYASKVLTYCERMNVGIMTANSEIYPARLRAIHAKPLVLYYRGRVPNIDDHVLVACVGTRKCSKNGKENAYRLGADLAEAGAIVVSGMALGIDAAVQTGALDKGGHTIAVLGCGIDRVYPPEHEDLMARIAEHGTVLTEYAPGTDPNGKHFPIRNRIISGLSLGTVVVEANDRSGALITARHAERQGRDLFAYPGNVGDALSEGTNELIKNGAHLVTCAWDVLSEYEPLFPHRICTERLIMAGRRVKMNGSVRASHGVHSPDRYVRLPDEEPPKRPKKSAAPSTMAPLPKPEKPQIDTTGLSDAEAQIVTHLTHAMPPEELARILRERTGQNIPVGELLGMLTVLEIGGYLEALPGGAFRPIEKDA